MHTRKEEEEEEEDVNDLFIPHDVTCDILMMLPAKSLARFRFVCSQWNAEISDPAFVQSHFSRTLRARYQGGIAANLILTFPDGLNRDIYSVTVWSNQEYSNSLTYQLTIPYFPEVYFIQSVHGLVALFSQDVESVFICNPSTGTFTKLPSPRPNLPPGFLAGHFRMTLLGFDPVCNRHKVLDTLVTTARRTPRGALRWAMDHRVWDFGSNHWRRIEIENMHHCPYAGYGSECIRYVTNPGICINGSIFYRAFIGPPPRAVVVAFDVAVEVFKFISKPITDDNFMRSTVMFEYEGHLALADCEEGNKALTIWVLVDEENEVWVKNIMEIPWPECWERESRRGISYFAGTTITGDFMFAPRRGLWKQSRCLFFYDIKTTTMRKVEIGGLTEFYPSTYTDATLCDHVESILSTI